MLFPSQQDPKNRISQSILLTCWLILITSATFQSLSNHWRMHKMQLKITNEEFDTIIMNLWMHRKTDNKTKELYERLKVEQKDNK